MEDAVKRGRWKYSSVATDGRRNTRLSLSLSFSGKEAEERRIPPCAPPPSPSRLLQCVPERRQVKGERKNEVSAPQHTLHTLSHRCKAGEGTGGERRGGGSESIVANIKFNSFENLKLAEVSLASLPF